MSLLREKLRARGAHLLRGGYEGGGTDMGDAGGEGGFGSIGGDWGAAGAKADAMSGGYGSNLTDSWAGKAAISLGLNMLGLPGFLSAPVNALGGRVMADWNGGRIGLGQAYSGGQVSSGTGDPSMATTDYSNLFTAAGGLIGALGGDSGSSYQNKADPFAPYRSNLAAMYAGYLQPGTSVDITQMPGYSQYKTGVLDPAMEATKRSGAASGMLFSGNEQSALFSQGQQGYYNFMTDYLNRLAQGSGATNNPAAAAQLGATQGNLNQAGIMQALGGLGTVIPRLQGLFGGSSLGSFTPSGAYDVGSNLWGMGVGGSSGLYGDAAAGMTDLASSSVDTWIPW